MSKRQEECMFCGSVHKGACESIQIPKQKRKKFDIPQREKGTSEPKPDLISKFVVPERKVSQSNTSSQHMQELTPREDLNKALAALFPILHEDSVIQNASLFPDHLVRAAKWKRDNK